MLVLLIGILILNHILNLIRINLIFLVDKSRIIQQSKIAVLMILRIPYEKVSLTRSHNRTLKVNKTPRIVDLIHLKSSDGPHFKPVSSGHLSPLKHSPRILSLSYRAHRSVGSMSPMGGRLSRHVKVRDCRRESLSLCPTSHIHKLTNCEVSDSQTVSNW